MHYSFQGYWRQLLPQRGGLASISLVSGWSFVTEGLPTFKEAPLRKSEELGSPEDQSPASIVLVSAPGAVGKTTLARQLAFETGALYIDLAMADPVGANSLSGGLIRSDLYQQWQEGLLAILIDGIDEARLKVTEQAFRSFLDDVTQLSSDRTVPTIIFGRTGSVQDAWLVFEDLGTSPQVLEIGYYDAETSVDFAEAHLRALRPDSPHQEVEREALTLIIEHLRNQTDTEGDRFAGYAPVLQAIVERVHSENNTQQLIEQVKDGVQTVTLQSVLNAILHREHNKLDPIRSQFIDPDVADGLYLPDEQVDRLVAHVYGLPGPNMPNLASKDAEKYQQMLATWVPEHPFLIGAGTGRSVVFDAFLYAHALRSSIGSPLRQGKTLERQAPANPFLSDFYLKPEEQQIVSTHIGVVYASVRAGLSIGDKASLELEEEESDDVEVKFEDPRYLVEISVLRKGKDIPDIKLSSLTHGSIHLGSHIEDVTVIAPSASVIVGPDPEALFVAPVYLECDELSISAKTIIVEGHSSGEEETVYLLANKSVESQSASAPIVRGNVTLGVTWPGAKSFPWTSYVVEMQEVHEDDLVEALRKFGRFVIEFRSHGNRGLARYAGKIDSSRMTKGNGQEILKIMMEAEILSRSGNYYFLNPKRLGELTGASYVDWAQQRYGSKAIDFVERALKEGVAAHNVTGQ